MNAVIASSGPRLENDRALGELSMVMKGETLPVETNWEGSPVRPRP